MYDKGQLYDHQVMDVMDGLENGTRRFQIFAWDTPYFILIPGESHIPSDPEHTIDIVKNWSTEHRPLIRGFASAVQLLDACFTSIRPTVFSQEQKTFG